MINCILGKSKTGKTRNPDKFQACQNSRRAGRNIS